MLLRTTTSLRLILGDRPLFHSGGRSLFREIHEAGDCAQPNRQEPRQLRSALEQTTHPEAEEARHEDEVGEVRDGANFGRDLADERELEREHTEGDQGYELSQRTTSVFARAVHAAPDSIVRA